MMTYLTALVTLIAFATGHHDLALMLISRELNNSATGARHMPTFYGEQWAFARFLIRGKRRR
jgi:hypothetical protein